MRISTATRSPARTPQRAAVSSVISSMMPRGSWPGIIGRPRPPMAPLYCSTSLPQMPHASTRSSAPVSPPSVGRGYSRISICRGPVCTTARTMSATCLLLGEGGYVERDQRRRAGGLGGVGGERPVLGACAAVDDEVAAGDEPRVVRRDPGDHVADVGRGGRLAHRDLPAHVER